MIIQNEKRKKIKCDSNSEHIFAKSECGYQGIFVKSKMNFDDFNYIEIVTIPHSRKDNLVISVYATTFTQYYGEYKFNKSGIFIDSLELKRFVKCDNSSCENIRLHLKKTFLTVHYIFMLNKYIMGFMTLK